MTVEYDLGTLDAVQLADVLAEVDAEIESETDESRLRQLRRRWSTIVLLINTRLQIKESA